MRSRFTLALGGVAMLMSMAAGCGESADPRASSDKGGATTADIPDVLVTFYPTKYFAERIGAEFVDVSLPLPEGEDPIFWTPDADTIRAYQDADVVIVNGAEFEKWAMTAPLARSRVVDTSAGFADQFVHYETGISHSHGPSGEHSHTGVDGHTWLDPILAIEQAGAIERAFSRLLPNEAVRFETNRDELSFDLLAIDQALRELTPRLAKVRLLASHPAYNYIARRYGWEITNLDLDPEAPISEAGVGEVLRAAGSDEESPIVLLWEGEPTAEAVSALSATGVRSVLFSPAENPAPGELEAQGDYLAMMRANVRRLADALPE